jgi:phenylacetic acid degradation operon negative regulatory protein
VETLSSYSASDHRGPAASAASMHAARVDAAIAACLAGEAAGANALVLHVMGQAAQPAGGHVWLSSLIELLDPFGVSERLVRTSVFRLIQQGELYSVRHGRRSASGLAAPPHALRQPAAPEPAGAPPEAWQNDWTLVMGWTGQLNLSEAAALRKQLWGGGYRLIAPGVLARPGGAPATLAAELELLGLERKLWVCHMTELHGVNQRPLAELVEEAWNLSDASAAYQAVLDRYAPLRDCLDAAAQLDPRQAFVLRTLLQFAWRRAQCQDPQLPAQLLPPRWPRARAAALFRQLCELTADGASRYLEHALDRASCIGPAAPRAIERVRLRTPAARRRLTHSS